MITVLLTLLLCLLTALVSGVVSDCYVNILTQPGHVLGFWASFLYRLRDKYVGTTINEFNEGDGSEQDAEHYAVRHDRAEYVLKPILTCHYCVAGQLGFWLSLYNHYQYSTNIGVILWLVTAAISVWSAGFISAIRERWFPL